LFAPIATKRFTIPKAHSKRQKKARHTPAFLVGLAAAAAGSELVLSKEAPELMRLDQETQVSLHNTMDASSTPCAATAAGQVAGSLFHNYWHT
jgi:hypothetical protein